MEHIEHESNKSSSDVLQVKNPMYMSNITTNQTSDNPFDSKHVYDVIPANTVN